MLDATLKKEIVAQYQKLRSEGKLLSFEELQRYFSLFRERFGPDRLNGLDGRDLLFTMHALSARHRDSLVYWLEFKNDEEFATYHFGSISGGSALKFGVYQRKEDGTWMTGSPQNQIELTQEAAIDIARRHRQQLFKGIELIDQLPPNSRDSQYQELQRQLEHVAPDICNTAWAHKYFYLLFPEKLDDYHVEHYQRFHLTKLLIEPPSGSGRYFSAGRFVEVSGELGWPMNHLTAVLNHRDGRPHKYWRVLVQYPDQEEFRNVWPAMRNGNLVALGWSDLGDLSDIEYSSESKKRVLSLMLEHYNERGGFATEIFHYVAGIQEGDIVLAFERSEILGIGRATGPYVYDPVLPQVPHHHPVKWLTVSKWALPEPEAKGRVTRQLKKAKNLVEIERRILVAEGGEQPPIGRAARLTGIPGRVQTILDRKKQVILHGPPGTGKTYWARIAAQELAAHRSFGKPFDGLSLDEKVRIWEATSPEGPLVRICTFHPAYGYEDFLEGYRPETTTEQSLVFGRRDGIFKRLCKDARSHPEQNYYLVIDEINRGDIPRIFGELLTVLEKDKRGQSILMPLSGEAFSVPENVYVVGTMNTADRSIALLDTALRRRFGFIELMPDISLLAGAVVGNTIPLGKWLEELNMSILAHIGRDARNLQIGHAYLLEQGRPVTDMDRFVHVLQDDIVPLLEEYCYEDYATLSNILGDGFVDQHKQRVRHELFRVDRRDDLLSALAKQWPELITSSDVVASEATSEELAEEEENEIDENPTE